MFSVICQTHVSDKLHLIIVLAKRTDKSMEAFLNYE